MKFKNPVLNKIAQDCGFTIDFSNPQASMREIEVLAEKVLDYNSELPWIPTNGHKPAISNVLRICVLFRDGEVRQGFVDDWRTCWEVDEHSLDQADIISYRILEE